MCPHMGSSTARSLHGVSSQRATLTHDSRLTVRGQCTVHEVSVPEVTIRPRAHGGQGPRVWGRAGGGGGDSWWWGDEGATERGSDANATNTTDCGRLPAAARRPPSSRQGCQGRCFPTRLGCFGWSSVGWIWGLGRLVTGLGILNPTWLVD